MIQFGASADEVGARLDVVVAARAGVPRTLAQRAITSGAITVAGRMVRPSYRLEEADVVSGEVPDPVFAAPEAEDIPVEVRYSDDRVLVVSKPPGLVTHPAAGHTSGTLVNALLALGGPLARGSSSRPGIVHRLDKDTSGLLLVARDDAAHAALVEHLRARAITRRYLALVRGAPPSRSGTIDAPVGRHPSDRKRMAVVPGGRASVTHYDTLAATATETLLGVTLETGRTHQIRVHLGHLGHPVVGDRTYGGRSDRSIALGCDRPFLHAAALAFPHPDDGRRIEVTDPLPADLEAVLERAGIAVPR
ncbi:MAG TPA: RluA family pseudouridine synthase [Actinomycetota bacterium]|nr:RluA family pseudouridine synthase [Actinomycetota bacterium]